MTGTAIRVLIVDDHPVVRSGTRALLAKLHDIEVVGEASGVAEACEQASFLRPNVVVMDLAMPDGDGINGIEQITQECPETRVLVFTGISSDETIVRAFRSGAAGYLMKDVGAEDVIRAVRDVHRGETPIQPRIARRLIAEWTSNRQGQDELDALTRREKEVLLLMARGLLDDEIAGLLGIGGVTVRTHVNHLLGKLQAASRVQAVLKAVQSGLLRADDVRPR